MDYFQTVVGEWLTADGRTLIAQEYGLRTSDVRSFKSKNQTNLWPDIVAVRLMDKKVYLCEITWSRDWQRIKLKLDNYWNLLPSIKDALECWLGIPQTEEWAVSVWYFVPESHTMRIMAMRPGELNLRVTKLEDIKPWTYTHGWRQPDDRAVDAGTRSAQ